MAGDFDPHWLCEQWEDFIKPIAVANVQKNKSEALAQRVVERSAQHDQTDKAAPATEEPLSRSCDTGYGEAADADRSHTNQSAHTDIPACATWNNHTGLDSLQNCGSDETQRVNLSFCDSFVHTYEESVVAY